MNDTVRNKSEVKGEAELRRARFRRLAIIFGLVVLLPTLLSVVYYGAMASPQYGSVTTLSLETGVARAGGKKGAASKDLDLLKAFVESRAAYEALLQTGFREHYGSGDIDRFSRLGEGDDAGYAFYQEQLEIEPASDAAIDVVFYAFDPDQAQAMSQALLSHLKAQLAAEREKTRELLVAPAIARAEAQREALAKASGDVETDVAQRRLTAALREVEMAQEEVLQREARLVVVAEPSRPDAAKRPRRLWNIATIFFTTLALGGLVLLLGDVVREHGQF